MKNIFRALAFALTLLGLAAPQARAQTTKFAYSGLLNDNNTDSNGLWPSGAVTVNPSGGDTTPIVITSSDAPLSVALPQIT